MKKLLPRLASIGLVAALFVGTSDGDLVVSQAPSGATTYVSDSAFPQYIADNFVVTTGGAFSYDITFYGIYFPTASPLPSDLFTIRVYNVTGGGGVGSLNTTLLSNGAADTRNATGNILFGVQEYVYTYRATAELDPGTYWLAIQNDTSITAPADDFWNWESGNLDPVGGVANAAFSIDSTTWSVFDGNLAFTIETRPVPEPSGIGNLALLGLFSVRRRRSQ